MFIARECTFRVGNAEKTNQEVRDGNRTRLAGSRVQHRRPLGEGDKNSANKFAIMKQNQWVDWNKLQVRQKLDSHTDGDQEECQQQQQHGQEEEEE